MAFEVEHGHHYDDEYKPAQAGQPLLVGEDDGNSESQHHARLPDREGLLWEERRFPTNIVDNPFTGDPRPQLDEAWHRLLLNDNIRVPKDYLDELNLTSIYTKDGSEGIVSLSVYHSLHCLKKVKRMLFKEHYHQGKSSEAMAREAKHVDHCIEYIRESLMCQPDLSMVTFRWINNTAQHEDKSEFYPTNFDVSMHRCANWEALDAWSAQRMFDLFQVDLLQRPKPEGSLPGLADE
ncbi:hypothetical protein DL764_008806 [Monosporascus ibericus]|uniref:Uncharacterized protein n=1 Tax=Monosporascus ibericus TaxID=155417 RepID=A0A4Q4SZK9_9PEZI|nr:hypothetical protein DL764_008806 [Monosporascus ibericus]